MQSMPLPSDIEWIVLDAVGTVITPDPPVASVYHAVGRRHGSRLTEAEVDAKFKQVFRTTERNDLEGSHPLAWVTSEAREHRRWRIIVGQVIDDVPDPQACFEELFVHFARPESWRCFPDVAPALQAWKSLGLRLMLASNFDRRLHAVSSGIPALAPIERRLISAEVGWRKPSPQFFASLIDAAGCAPRKILMIGDDYENDIQGAAAAGLATQWICRKPHPPPQAISSLLELQGLEPP